MHPLARRVALLLFGSGTCALIYEIAWFREFRLVFGASTSANAAVLAMFVGGLGMGGLVLGKYADRSPRPILLYAKLEIIAAVLAALTPAFLWLTRKAYIAMGGSAAVGPFGATALRLILTMVVLFAPTFVMGGTLPAAVRGIETEGDRRRRGVGLLYGCNTLGAVFGCVLANFVLLEAVGTRSTLWIAAVANLAIALAARAMGKSMPAIVAPAAKTTVSPPATAESTPNPTAVSPPTATESMPRTSASTEESLSPAFVLGASAAVGFAFFLMELVWYRMLGPLLGGTVFTFGIILAVALFGIGLGGACYAFFGADREATLGGFALTCLLEALFIALPYALGDRIAMVALLIRPLGAMKFVGLVMGWTMVTAIVVLPASFVAGIQFPMLIALLGRGRDRVGAHTGLAYAANTAGAIAGALAGGFGLLPALSVLGSWRLVAWLLTILGVAAGLAVMRRSTSWFAPVSSVLLGAVVIFLLEAEGPTAVWRHGQIGVGRAPPIALSSRNNYRQWTNMIRRAIRWESDGAESTVGLDGRMGWAFIVNGKSDGHARIDAPTQVMVGLLGALFHPGVKRAMVIGLGTGSTAGWLGALPGIERVDVAELEPAVLHVAEVASMLNHDALKNPRVHIAIGDARETLLTSHDTYDIIASEPSNPYRAGVASLYTREYYQAIRNRLAQDGIFLQWLQAYDVDNQTVRTVYATLGSVFSEVETWELEVNDLLLVASRKKINHDLPQIRERLKQEPFRSAFSSAWRALDVEGVFAHFVARGSLAKAISFVDKDQLNTDDRNVIEFGFARSTKASGESQSLRAEEIREVARSRDEHRPSELEKELDWERVSDQWIGFRAAEGNPTPMGPRITERQRPLVGAYENFLGGRLHEVVRAWRAFGREPATPTELGMVAEALADSGDDAALGYIERLREIQPTEAAAILGRLRFRQEKYLEAAYALEAAFRAYRTDAWAWTMIMSHALETTGHLMAREPTVLKILRPALEEPFAAVMLDESRREILLKLAVARDPDSTCATALTSYEPHPLWQQPLLGWRARCYEALHHAEATRAAQERDEYDSNEPAGINEGNRLVRGH
ncbi:MAG TPA: fused MFS/spermidine synthase [Polyangiaceae bacterium]|nr:fused MFS/spermidine synthase [Polyangiaceae bacterium]